MNPQPELLLHIVARIKERPEAPAEFERSISFLLGQGDGATAILTVRHLIAGGWNVESMQKLLDTLTLNVPVDGGRDEPVLYLDFDGVLHPYPTEDGHFEIPEESLFRFAPLLEAQLGPYPQVKIVLSTTWAKNKTGPGALLYLKRDPLPLKPSAFVRDVVYPLLDRGQAAQPDSAFAGNYADSAYQCANESKVASCCR